MHRNSLALSLCIAALATAVGCGGGGGGDSTTAAAPASEPKTEFIKRADVVCAKTEGRQLALLEEFGRRYGNPRKAGEAKIIRLAGVPPLREEAEELAKLKPPKSEAAEAKGVIEEFAKAVEAVEANPTVLTSQSPFVTVEEAAKQYGFKVCGGP